MSLPLLARGVSTVASHAAHRVGVLYALNTIGAAAGAFMSAWVLIPRIGIDGTMQIAAGLNLAAALLAVLLLIGTARTHSTAAPHVPETVTDVPLPLETPWRLRTWTWLYALAGFQALSLEILWFRLLGVTLKSSAFTFGTLLTIYLGGLAVGAALESVILRRVRRPALAFVGLQAFVSLYALLSVSMLDGLLQPGGYLGALSAYVSGYEPLDAAAAFAGIQQFSDTPASRLFLWLYIVVPVLLVGPPTVALGASFPLIQKAAILSLAHVGRRVGTLLLANIAGSALGAVLTGWLALTYLGTAGSFKALASLGGLFVLLWVTLALKRTHLRIRVAAGAACVAVMALLISNAPNGSELWATVHGASPRLVLQSEDASGVSLIKVEPHTFGTRGVVFVNGIGQSWIPYGNIHSVLGALPAFLHPNPHDAALIGLGSGDTLYSLASRTELTRIVSIEIVGSQLDTLRQWERQQGYPALTTLLTDQRIEHVWGDGRIHLLRSQRRFDIIEADALRPTSAYAGHLYSVGYFELVRSRLRDDGLAVTWAPTSRIHDTFTYVFPHVLEFGDILVGSSSPIPFDPAAIRARLRTPAVRAHYQRAGMDVEQLLAPYLDRAPRAIARTKGHPDNDLNQDLFPRDEFGVARTEGVIARACATAPG